MMAADVESRLLGPRFQRALQFAYETHADQRRKGSGVPYVGHLLGVAALVIDDGGSEDEAIAALLHDAAEDQGGEEMIRRLREWLGEDVARIVRACSDTLESPKPAWRERKEAYLRHLAETPHDDELRVALADKVYNAFSIVMDHRRQGARIWERFEAGRDETLWYYRTLANTFLARCSGPMADELARVVGELEQGARSDPQAPAFE